MADGTLVLTRSDIAALVTLGDCITVVEEAFRRHGTGEAPPPAVLGQHAGAGSFHIKAAMLDSFYTVKVNANFPANPERHGLPTIQGLVLLFETESGRPLAVMDSMEITLLRTAAATAVAAHYLARPDSTVLALCGCGAQGRVQVRAVCRVRPIRQVVVYDLDGDRAARFAVEMSQELGIPVQAASQPGEAARQSDICVTCTPSRQHFLGPDDVRAGTFVAAVGADSEDKQELEPALLAASRVVVDVLGQAAKMGDLNHALRARAMTREQVHAELGAVVAGLRPGRSSPSETFIFDSTGMALQDAAAGLAYRNALSHSVSRGNRQTLHFSH